MQWKTSKTPVPYPEAITQMEARVEQIIAGKAEDMVWFLEHPPVYTGGTSARPEDLLNTQQFPVYQTGRGGQYTYHGPGQLVAYVIKKLPYQDVRRHVHELEEWVIETLRLYNIEGERRKDRIGIWVKDTPVGEAKIAALGVRVKKWVAYHGVAINLHPDLAHFSGIIPCGIRQFGVTSLWELGAQIGRGELEKNLKSTAKRTIATK